MKCLNLLVQLKIRQHQAGGVMPVCSLKVIPKPCEKYNALPGVKCFLTVGHKRNLCSIA